MVGRKPRRAHDADLCLLAERAGFEPHRGAILAQSARGFNVRFAPIEGGLGASSRGSKPARMRIIAIVQSWARRVFRPTGRGFHVLPF
jgi:hypothetical protein